MKNEELHPVRFTKRQIYWIEHLARQIFRRVDTSDYLKGVCQTIFDTVEKFVKKDRESLTEGKTLGNVKDPPTTGSPSTPPPGQLLAQDYYQDCSKTGIKCNHANMRFRMMGPEVCPDCHTNVWLSDMVNAILDTIQGKTK